MNWFKRTWLSIIRRPAKTLMLFLVVFVMGNFLAGSLGIIITCNQIQSNLREELGATANISGKFGDEFALRVNYTEYKDSIDNYIHTVNTILNDERTLSGEYHVMSHGAAYNDICDKWFEFYGTNVEIPSEFIDKKHVMSGEDSSFFTKEQIENGEYVALVDTSIGSYYDYDFKTTFSTGLAEVGKTITLSFFASYEDENYRQHQYVYDVDFKVIGKFNAETKSKLQDIVYIPNKALEEITKKVAFEVEKLGYEPEIYFIPDYAAFLLKDGTNLEEFDADVKDLMQALPTTFEYTSSNTTYKRNAGAIENLNTIAKVIFIVSIFATVLVLGLVVISLIVERKKEMGIYMSIGEKSQHIILQITCEVLLTATLAIGSSSLSGLLLGNALSDYMLEVQRYVQRQQSLVAYAGLPVLYKPVENGVTNKTRDELMKNYEVEPSVEYFVTMLIVGELTIIASCGLPLLYLTKLKPKDIMI